MIKWGETWLYVHVMPLAHVLASHGANGIEHDIILFISSRKLKWGWNLVMLCHWHWWHMSQDTDGIIIGTIPFLMSKWLRCGAAWLFGHVLHLVLAYAACDADGIVNITIALFRSMWLKWGATWHFAYVMPLALMLASHYLISIVKGITTFLKWRPWKWKATCLLVMWHNCHCHWHHLMPLMMLQHHKWNHYII